MNSLPTRDIVVDHPISPDPASPTTREASESRYDQQRKDSSVPYTPLTSASPSSLLRDRFQALLTSVAERLFPEYKSKLIPTLSSYQRSTLPIKRPIYGNLYFQVLMYYNAFLCPVWLISCGMSTIWKLQYVSLTQWHFSLLIAFFATFVLIEPIRLYLGYTGNRMERVPDVSGCVVLSGIVLLSTLFMAFFQPVVGGFTLPLELWINVVYSIFVAVELVLGYYTAKAFVDITSIEFYLGKQESFDKEKPDLEVDRGFDDDVETVFSASERNSEVKMLVEPQDGRYLTRLKSE